MVDLADKTHRARFLTMILLIYAITFMTTLGFTGVVNYREALGPAVKVAGSLFKKEETKKKATKKTESPIMSTTSTTPITIPGPIPETPTSSVAVVAQSSDEAEKKASDLAKVYSNMDSDDAVKIFKNMTDDQVIVILKKMRGTAASDILAEMDSSRAARITSKIMKVPTTGASQ